MALLRYRYFQPADGRFHYPGAPSDPTPPFRLVYTGMIPVHGEESPQDVLARLVGRHTTPSRPEGDRCRPAGTGDLLDLGAYGFWRVLPVGFQALTAEEVSLELAA